MNFIIKIIQFFVLIILCLAVLLAFVVGISTLTELLHLSEIASLSVLLGGLNLLMAIVLAATT